MGKRNKIRYQSKLKPQVTLVMSGNVYLEYVDDEALEAPQKGDVKFYPYNEALNSTRVGEYESTGFAGYFKADIYDGWGWRLMLLNDIFPGQENYFSKNERPIDTYTLCREMFVAQPNRVFERIYREHYQPLQNESGEE